MSSRLPLFSLLLLGMIVAVLMLGMAAPPEPTLSQPQAAPYPRAGWTAELSTNFHGVDGVAEIIDERTVRLRNFYYDGGGPAVYAYLGTDNTDTAFENGIAIGPLLTRSGRAYEDVTLDLKLPDAGPTLDGFNAISIWCVDFKVNFGSGSFSPPAITLTKTVGINPAECAAVKTITLPDGGGEVTYCYTVQNRGAVTLTQHTLDDSALGTLIASEPITLTPGGAHFLTRTAMITETTVNTATWTAFNSGPSDVVAATDAATVTILKFGFYLPVIIKPSL